MFSLKWKPRRSIMARSLVCVINVVSSCFLCFYKCNEVLDETAQFRSFRQVALNASKVVNSCHVVEYAKLGYFFPPMVAIIIFYVYLMDVLASIAFALTIAETRNHLLLQTGIWCQSSFAIYSILWVCQSAIEKFTLSAIQWFDLGYVLIKLLIVLEISLVATAQNNLNARIGFGETSTSNNGASSAEQITDEPRLSPMESEACQVSINSDSITGSTNQFFSDIGQIALSLKSLQFSSTSSLFASDFSLAEESHDK